MTIPATNDMPDRAVRETANAKVHLETHLAPSAGRDALFVSRGTGTLGAGQGALTAQPGAGVVDGNRIAKSGDTLIDIREGDGEPRRDVVYLDTDGTFSVLEGDPAPFVWDGDLSDKQRTIANAHRPAAPDMVGVTGLALAVVTVPTNANSLPTQAIEPLRPRAPASALGDVQEFESVSTPGGTTNDVHVLDPGDDFGAAINDIDAQMSPGDHLFVPPGDYYAHTRGTITTPSTVVYSNDVATGYGNRVMPRIAQRGDVTPIRIKAENVTLRGLNVFSGVSTGGSSPGIEATGARTRIVGCYVRGFGSHGIHLRQTRGESLNGTAILDTAVTHNDGDGVRLDADGDVKHTNRNAIRIELSNAVKNKGWQINVNTFCFGNHYYIQNCSPSFGDVVDSKGGVKVDGMKSWVQLPYTESVYQNQYLIEFNGRSNVGMVGHIYKDFPHERIYHDTSSQPNWKWQFGHPDKPAFVGDRLGVGGQLRAADVLNQTPQSSPPSSPDADDIYVDDGTNTSDGSRGFRQYDGSTWVDF